MSDPKSAVGPSLQFAAAQQFGRFRSGADIQRAAIRSLVAVVCGGKNMPAARRVRERAVLFAKIVKIRPHIHRRTGCPLDEIVRHELAAVPVKIVMQPGMQGAEFLAISCGMSGCPLSAAA